MPLAAAHTRDAGGRICFLSWRRRCCGRSQRPTPQLLADRAWTFAGIAARAR